MKVFVTGVGGQLGYDLMNELERRGHKSIGSDIKDTSSFKYYIKLDITNSESVEKVLTEVKPDAVIHCAAWTDVDAAEDDDKHEIVKKINIDGTQNIASVCKKLGCKVMYISTDYVFDGQGIEPWKPDCNNYNPLNVYGKTKLDGEFAVAKLCDRYFIVRIAWVFGHNGKNFIRTMLSLADKGYKELNIIDDQIGTPTYTFDLSRLLVDMIETEKYGYYHATNEGGFISWADLAEEVFKQTKKNIKINRVSTMEYGLSKAIRPLNSRMDKSKLVKNGFIPLPHWKDAIRRYIDNEKFIK